MTWRFRLVLALLEMLGGAMLGWALSLTQGSDVHHWPWVVVGGVLVLAVGLIVSEAIARRRACARTPQGQSPAQMIQPGGVSIYARQIHNGQTGAILASGAESFIDIVSDDFTNSGVVHIDNYRSGHNGQPSG